MDAQRTSAAVVELERADAKRVSRTLPKRHRLSGPLITGQPLIRYGAAVLLTLGVGLGRYALVPLIGAEAPLLPFVLAVFAAAFVGGTGPAVAAMLLSMALTAAFFTVTGSPLGPNAVQWVAHLGLFALTCTLLILMMQRLQRADAVQRRVLKAARASERAAAEELARRREIEDALRKSERLLKLIYDNSSDALYLVQVEPEGRFRFVMVNETFVRSSGYPREQVEGRCLEEALCPTGATVLDQRFREAIENGAPVVYHDTAQLPAGLRHAEIRLTPIAGPDGRITHILGSVTDVTARRQAEEALREADRRKDDFLVMLAHELRNPLAPIVNVAHILSSGNVDQAMVRRHSELLHRQAAQLSHLVDDLLDVARITRGMIELLNEALLIEHVLDRAIETVQPLLDLKKQSVSRVRSPTPLLVEGDGVRLTQVFANLLSNAAKYSPDRSIIQLVIEASDDEVTVRVIDEGIGIDPQALPRVFELFMQADRSLDRREGGLGVGLTVVKHLVELHGGSVEAHSAGLGMGSEFTVRLPLMKLPVAFTAPAGTNVQTESLQRRVLVVEDNRDAAESLALVLRAARHEVQVAADGAEALATLEEFRADVVLLDIGLPGMDGYLVAQSIRERFPDAPLRLYALTGYGREEDRALAVSSGFDGHLTKPVEPAHLLELLATGKTCERRAARRMH